jgi:hypothetical protein
MRPREGLTKIAECSANHTNGDDGRTLCVVTVAHDAMGGSAAGGACIAEDAAFAHPRAGAPHRRLRRSTGS